MKKILPTLDLVMLSLMIVSLPSLEAPKNIFLVGFLVTRLITEVNQFKEGKKLWGGWDSLFATIVFTALLTTIFAGFPGLEEWKGYKVLLTAILTGWFLSRTYYSENEYQLLFKLIILSTIPPLVWGLYEYLVIHSRASLEVHSVGHVNHSAIYLVMIFGASLAWLLSHLNAKKEKVTLSWQITLLGILSLLFFISLIIGESRGAFGIAVILAMMLCLLLPLKKYIKLFGVLFISSMLILTVAVNAPIVKKQIINQENNNVLSARDRIWNVSIEAARFHPLLGIGLSNWHFINLDQLKKSVEDRGEIFDSRIYSFQGHSHNLYLSALVERGIVGLFVTFLFMVAWIRHLIKTFQWAKKSIGRTYLWGGSLSAWVATFGIGFVNTTFHHEHAILACLFLGIYLSYTRLFLKTK
ncbi:O-antigen ligase family protein [Candidatus Methylopumilus planktonicus]|uniref:O-antigen ligase family protein n=1 Tax=Candidatus Methylopumilus planktonicus TaxID=1581557 RepID=UPI001122814C|nr:O-antigen ligase family protein [Candidatus Methylopumilus planktonicus]QDD00484.1 O-antigen ligase family protein [Candidatus Methylopumilus planktonicus]